MSVIFLLLFTVYEISVFLISRVLRVILKCPALANIREIHIKDLRDLVIGKVGQEVWSEKFCSETVLLSLTAKH